MRVLAIAWAFSDHRFGGEPIHAFELVRHLAARGVEVHVVSPLVDVAGELDGRVVVRPVRGERVRRGNTGWNKVVMWRAARGLMRGGGFDVVHLVTQFTSFPIVGRPFVMTGCFDPRPSAVGAAARGVEGFVRRLRGAPARERGGLFVDAAYALVVERALGWGLDRTLSEADAVVVRQSRGVPFFAARARRVEYVPVGVDPGLFSPGVKDGSVLFVGNFERYKGVDVLLEAFARALPRLPAASRLRLVGSGPEERALRVLVDALGLGGRVDFLGRVSRERLVDLFARASVFVLPSRRESFGGVNLEAMASGTPVVTTTGVVGAVDYVEDGVNGFLVPSEAPGAIAEALVRVLGDGVAASRLGARARETALRFSWAGIAAKYAALYEDLARSARA